MVMDNTECKIVYAGCTESGFNILHRLLNEGFSVSEIVTLSPDMARSNNVSGFYDFRQYAESKNIPTYIPQTYALDNKNDIEHFNDVESDLLIVHGWQRLIPASVLDKFNFGGLGAHGSAFGLPKGRGRSPMNWSLIEGLNRFVLSLITLSATADSGAIVTSKKFEITNFDNIQSLYFKLELALEQMLVESIPLYLNDEIQVKEQSGEATYYAKRRPEDGGIDWRDPTHKVYNLIRAVTHPYPGAFTKIGSTTIHIWDAIPFSYDFVFPHEPGKVLRVHRTTGQFIVKTADGTLLVRKWTANDWTPEQGMILESVENPSTNSPHRFDSPENIQRLSDN